MQAKEAEIADLQQQLRKHDELDALRKQADMDAVDMLPVRPLTIPDCSVPACSPADQVCLTATGRFCYTAMLCSFWFCEAVLYKVDWV